MVTNILMTSQHAPSSRTDRICLVAKPDQEPVEGVLQSAHGGASPRPRAIADTPKIGPDSFETFWRGVGRDLREAVRRDSGRDLEASASGRVCVEEAADRWWP
jgi:hypothetical protein